jgi:hypothetical protein
VTEGDNLQTKTDLAEQTLTGYLGSAHAWLETVLKITIPIRSTAMGGKAKLHPCWARQLTCVARGSSQQRSVNHFHMT